MLTLRTHSHLLWCDKTLTTTDEGLDNILVVLKTLNNKNDRKLKRCGVPLDAQNVVSLYPPSDDSNLPFDFFHRMHQFHLCPVLKC